MLPKYSQVQLGADYADTLVEFLQIMTTLPSKYATVEGRTTILNQ